MLLMCWVPLGSSLPWNGLVAPADHNTEAASVSLKLLPAVAVFPGTPASLPQPGTPSYPGAFPGDLIKPLFTPGRTA